MLHHRVWLVVQCATVASTHDGTWRFAKTALIGRHCLHLSYSILPKCNHCMSHTCFIYNWALRQQLSVICTCSRMMSDGWVVLLECMFCLPVTSKLLQLWISVSAKPGSHIFIQQWYICLEQQTTALKHNIIDSFVWVWLNISRR